MNSREITERLIPVLLVKSVVHFGVADPTEPEHAAVLRLLDDAVEVELAGLPSHQRASIERHAGRVANALLKPLIAQRMECAKAGLAIFYVLNGLVDADLYHYSQPFWNAMDALVSPEGTVTEMANIAGVDRSAEKHARKLLSAMQGMGYFVGQVAA